MTFKTLHYSEINISDRPFITHYSLIWINVAIKWLLLEQFELMQPKILACKLAKGPVACFVVVVSRQ